jgi:transposase
MKPSVQRLFPTKDCIFQQDNDPKHTARSIRTYLENYEVPTLPWPSQSPDLNPIENLWSILDLKVKDRKPSNEEALFEVLKEAWQNLEPELLTKLADSMPDRIEAVIAANGYPTKY